MRKRIVEFLEFHNGKLQQKRGGKRQEKLAAEDIGFAELKITKVSIRRVLFRFLLSHGNRHELTYLVHFRVSRCIFTFQYRYAPIRKLNTETRNICAITVSRFKAKLFYLTWFYLTNFLSEMYRKKSWRTFLNVS